ncbi:cellulose binding domain-containing protein [Streptomyces sp. NPDC029080]|uniref:cellulose binding domain-containing protein n=1 Tax=Streptomyces sp. NPDC029080 TaxID=3155017 RepID=UPI0033D3745F
MPDLPTAQDDTEAELFSECWDTVLSYADLCTSGSLTAHQLATEAFTLGMREIRAAVSTRGGSARAARLPAIPALLTAVRDTAARWEAAGQGHRLDPDLRLWLGSGGAARFAGPPQRRPLALRGLRDMRDADAALLWLAEVEALPLPTVARRLGRDQDTVAGELDRARTLFRDRCHRAHLDSPLDAQCRGYARLLDAVTRSPAAEAPGDLSRHLATCVRCAEAAACLRLHGGALPAALADGVIGWGGLAYLERRRRATEARLGAGRPDPGTADPEEGTGRNRALRGGLAAVAVLLSALALGVSMMPFDRSDDDLAATQADRRPVTGPDLSRPAARATATGAPAARATGSPPAPPVTSRPPRTHRRAKPAPAPQGTSSATHRASPAGTPVTAPPAGCRVAFDVTAQWPDGFQAAVTVTTDRALTDWQVAWTFRDGQQAGRTWDARVRQSGSRVTAVAADYDRVVPAHGTLSFGFLGTWRNRNHPPTGFTLNGAPCALG